MNSHWKKLLFWLGMSFLLIGSLIVGGYYLLKPPPGRTNILVLGVAGENHTGSDLTDTIIFFSIENESGKSLLLSLPRDIWVPSLRTKLNSVYHYEGMDETKSVVSNILGQKIDYSLLVDFDVFTKMVDLLDGVEVDVERSFDDYRYPIVGREDDLCDGDPEFNCRYQDIHFEAGKQWMDGQTALKYVRSRNAEGDEGTDFARSQRQQRLLLAIKKRLFNPQVLFSYSRLDQLIKLVNENIKTDISSSKYDDLLKIGLKIKKSKMKTEVLNDGYLVNPPPSREKYDNQWVLIPESGDWQEVHQHVQNLLGD